MLIFINIKEMIYINDITDMKVAIFCGGPIYLKSMEEYITPPGGEKVLR